MSNNVVSNSDPFDTLFHPRSISSLVTSAIGLACGDAASIDKSRQHDPDGVFEDSVVTMTAKVRA